MLDKLHEILCDLYLGNITPIQAYSLMILLRGKPDILMDEIYAIVTNPKVKNRPPVDMMRDLIDYFV